MDEVQNKDMQRRAVIRGVAWTVPAAAVAVAAPAIAASDECTMVTQNYNYQGNPVRVTVPPEATHVNYIVHGGGGGSGFGSKGAHATGQISFNNSNSPRTLLVIVGQGGQITTDGTTASGGYGYGRGGNSTTGPRATNSAPSGGGGGGSAILIDNAARTPVVVSGGGGGAAVTHTVSGRTELTNTHNSPSLTFQYGNGSAGVGSGNGRAGGVGAVGSTGTGLATNPALSGTGASGGRGGGTARHVANNNWSEISLSGGADGGNFRQQGAGNEGGDGGNGAPRLSNGSTMQASAGGGGGGYAGGGGGGMARAKFGTDNLWSISAGSGAAGSNYAMTTGVGLTVSNDGFQDSARTASAARGHQGFIQLSWCV